MQHYLQFAQDELANSCRRDGPHLTRLDMTNTILNQVWFHGGAPNVVLKRP